MKNILLLTAFLTIAIGAAVSSRSENIADIVLPEVQITGKRILPILPEVKPPMVISRSKEASSIVLPEVVITARRLHKV